MMFTLTEILKLSMSGCMFLWLHHAVKWKYYKYLVPHFRHISPKFNLTHWVSAETRDLHHNLKKYCEFEQSLAAHLEFILSCPPMGSEGLKRFQIQSQKCLLRVSSMFLNTETLLDNVKCL